jgi:hypothetical protein
MKLLKILVLGSVLILSLVVGQSVYSQDDDDILDFLPAILASASGPRAPQCCQSISSEAAAQGDYRLWSYSNANSLNSVAISNRGWRAVAGGADGNLYFFTRSQGSPLFTYTIGDQVTQVDITRNGCAFVAGGLDGRIYYFECDSNTPAWIYDTSQDIASGSASVQGVSISQDGRWIAAISNWDVYLFRRDRSTPELKVRLSTSLVASDMLSTVALSADGSRLAVGKVLGDTGSWVYYLNHSGLVWSYFIAGVDCGMNYKPTPVAISANGSVVAGGGCDGRLYLWDGTSSTPRWNYLMPNGYAVTSLAISDDGSKLAAGCGNLLYYIDDTTTAPDFANDTNNWEWDGWVSSYSQPSVYPGHDNVPGDTWLGVSGDVNGVRMSADGNYVSAAAYVYGYVHNFYRTLSEPFRVVHLSNTVDSVGALDISPDGSWISYGGLSSQSGEFVRMEVAPAEFVTVDFPLTFRVSDPPANELVEIIGGDKFKVDYLIIKPGRAANLDQQWAMWAYSGGLVIPPNDILCSGTMEWSFNQNLADGNQIITGTHELEPPQCLQSSVSTIDYFYLVDELTDDPSDKELSDDSAILATVQIAAGN